MQGAAVGGRAIWAFKSTGAGQISTEAGEAVQVLARDNSEWWFVRTEAGGEGYVPASYVQLDGSEGAGDAGSVASQVSSAASAQSSAGSAESVGSLSRFMKSAHGRKKRQQVQQQDARPDDADSEPATGANAEAQARVAGANEKLSESDVARENGDVQQLKQAHAESLAKLTAESEQRNAAHEAELTQLRVSLQEAVEQHELDQLELKASRAALTTAEDATSATKQLNEHLKAAAGEHALTEKRLRAEIESLRSQLDRSHAEVARLRTAEPVATATTKPGSNTTSEQTNATTSDNGSPTRPQSAPVDWTDARRGRSMTPQARWTALGASESEPQQGRIDDSGRPSSANGTVSRQRSRRNHKGGRFVGKKKTNMRPQSAPARHSVALSELSSTMLPGNPPDLLAQRAHRRRHYSKPPPNGAQTAGVGLGAAAAAAAKQRQSLDSTIGQAYALMEAASEMSSMIPDINSENQSQEIA